MKRIKRVRVLIFDKAFDGHDIKTILEKSKHHETKIEAGRHTISLIKVTCKSVNLIVKSYLLTVEELLINEVSIRFIEERIGILRFENTTIKLEFPKVIAIGLNNDIPFLISHFCSKTNVKDLTNNIETAISAIKYAFKTLSEKGYVMDPNISNWAIEFNSISHLNLVYLDLVFSKDIEVIKQAKRNLKQLRSLKDI